MPATSAGMTGHVRIARNRQDRLALCEPPADDLGELFRIADAPAVSSARVGYRWPARLAERRGGIPACPACHGMERAILKIVLCKVETTHVREWRSTKNGRDFSGHFLLGV
jgi:hypothetical protein